MTLDLTEDEELALAGLLKRAIRCHRDFAPLKAILAKLEPRQPVAKPYPAPPRRSPLGSAHNDINLPSAAAGTD